MRLGRICVTSSPPPPLVRSFPIPARNIRCTCAMSRSDPHTRFVLWGSCYTNRPTNSSLRPEAATATAAGWAKVAAAAAAGRAKAAAAAAAAAAGTFGQRVDALGWRETEEKVYDLFLVHSGRVSCFPSTHIV